MIAAILAHETDAARQTLTLGDWVEDSDGSPAGDSYSGALRTSDFMPDHAKAFAKAAGEPRWTGIADRTYSIFDGLIAGFSPKTGLLPDFVVLRDGKYAPAPRKFLEGGHDGFYAYNTCRDPWRIGTDYLISGDPRALALLRPLNTWICKAASGDPDKINAGYKLDGKRLAEDDSAAFTGPFAVAAMADASRQKWLDALWTRLRDRSPDDETYFGNTVKLLTLIVLSGNWVAP